MCLKVSPVTYANELYMFNIGIYGALSKTRLENVADRSVEAVLAG